MDESNPERIGQDWAAARARLRASWACVGRVSAMPSESSVAVTLDETSILLTRDRHGHVRGFHNVCSHRGHPLAEPACRRAPRVTCPYHGWSYGFDGALRNTPHIGGAGVHQVAGFDPLEHGLQPVALATWWDFIFVNLDGGAAPIDEHVASLEARWQRFLGAAGVSVYVPTSESGFSLDVAGAWSLAVENYCESYHLPFIHPALNSYSRIEDHYTIVDTAGFAGQGTRVYEPRYLGEERFPSHPDWPEELAATAEYVALFPNLLLGLHRDHAFCVILEPLSPTRTREHCHLYFLEEAATGATHARLRGLTRDAWVAVFEEDIPVVEGMQRGRASPAYQGGAFSPVLETGSIAFYDWLHQH